MQDVVYVDEGIEEVTEVYMTPSTPLTSSPVASEQNIVFVSTPFTRTNSSPAALRPSLLHSSSIIEPEDCPIVPTPPTLSDPTN